MERLRNLADTRKYTFIPSFHHSSHSTIISVVIRHFAAAGVRFTCSSLCTMFLVIRVILFFGRRALVPIHWRSCHVQCYATTTLSWARLSLGSGVSYAIVINKIIAILLLSFFAHSRVLFEFHFSFISFQGCR